MLVNSVFAVLFLKLKSERRWIFVLNFCSILNNFASHNSVVLIAFSWSCYCSCVGKVARRVEPVALRCKKFCNVNIWGCRENQKSVAGSSTVFWTFAAFWQCSDVAAETGGFETNALSVFGFAVYVEIAEISKQHRVWDRYEQVLCCCASWFRSFCKWGWWQWNRLLQEDWWLSWCWQWCALKERCQWWKFYNAVTGVCFSWSVIIIVSQNNTQTHNRLTALCLPMRKKKDSHS